MKRMIVFGLVVGVLLLATGCLPLPGGPGNGGAGPDADVVAAFTWEQDANNSRTIHLDGSGSSTTLGKIAFYEWFPMEGGAAVVMTVPAVSHTYAEWGTYNVRLVVTDTGGRSAAVTVEVTVEPLQPVARFSWVVHPTILRRVDFDATNSTADGEIVSARWWFGDGTGVEGPWADVVQWWHKYADLGAYTVTLTITDQHGQTATRIRKVTTAP